MGRRLRRRPRRDFHPLSVLTPKAYRRLQSTSGTFPIIYPQNTTVASVIRRRPFLFFTSRTAPAPLPRLLQQPPDLLRAPGRVLHHVRPPEPHDGPAHGLQVRDVPPVPLHVAFYLGGPERAVVPGGETFPPGGEVPPCIILLAQHTPTAIAVGRCQFANFQQLVNYFV